MPRINTKAPQKIDSRVSAPQANFMTAIVEDGAAVSNKLTKVEPTLKSDVSRYPP